jgi:DNA-binding response OmpR family regulator
MKILLAEDDITSRTMLTAILIKWGYETLACEDGNVAWAELQKPDAPRLVLLDWNMPGLEGLEVCRRLRKKETNDPSYVIRPRRKGRHRPRAGSGSQRLHRQTL